MENEKLPIDANLVVAIRAIINQCLGAQINVEDIKQSILDAVAEGRDNLAQILVKIAVKLTDKISPKNPSSNELRQKIGTKLLNEINKEPVSKMLQATISQN
ncbi:MAG: hypothetical protein WCV72_04445 [Patescibacteria group bacterium]